MRYALGAMLLLLGLAGPAGAWEKVLEEHGILVEEQAVAGRNLPMFRGRGVVNAGLYEVIAVLSDADRRTQWLHRCVESKIVARLDAFTTVAYTRTDAPWPVDDRDAVMLAQLFTVEPGRVYRAQFTALPDPRMPPRDGIVRMKHLHGHWVIEALSPSSTRVEYEVDADPGGLLPGWLAARASRELPLQSVLGLRRQTRRTRGVYDAFLDQWDPERRPKDAPTPAQPPVWKP